MNIYSAKEDVAKEEKTNTSRRITGTITRNIITSRRTVVIDTTKNEKTWQTMEYNHDFKIARFALIRFTIRRKKRDEITIG